MMTVTIWFKEEMGNISRTSNTTSAILLDVFQHNAQKVEIQEQILRRSGIFSCKEGITRTFQGHGCVLILRQQ